MLCQAFGQDYVCGAWYASGMDGEELRRRRTALKMSQAELGRRLGTSQQTVFKWESGERNVQHPPMMELALRWLAMERIVGGQVDVWQALEMEPAPRPGQGVDSGL